MRRVIKAAQADAVGVRRAPLPDFDVDRTSELGAADTDANTDEHVAAVVDLERDDKRPLVIDLTKFDTAAARIESDDHRDDLEVIVDLDLDSTDWSWLRPGAAPRWKQEYLAAQYGKPTHQVDRGA